MKKESKIDNYCSSCMGVRNHKTLHEKIEYGSEDYHCRWIYSMVECLGCENISYRSVFEDLESMHDDHENRQEDYITVHTYPIALQNHRSLKRIWELPDQVKLVYDESLRAFANGCYLLTGVAFRAVIEAVCMDKGIKARNLEVKINKLLSNKFITESEATRLHAIRFLGNDAVHEMLKPKKEVLYLLLDIIEHLLNNLYLIDIEISANRNLKGIITDFYQFNKLLNSKLRLFSSEDEFTISTLLGRDSRRIKDNIDFLRDELIEKINKVEIEYIEIGRTEGVKGTKNFKQYFNKKVNKPISAH